VSIFVVGTLAAAAFMSRRNSGERGIPVRLEVVQPRDLSAFVEASGNIRAVRTVDLSSDISARVATVYIREGDYVTQGQRLLSLETDTYEAAVDRTEASLAQARAGLTQQEANLESARLELARNESLNERGGLVSLQALDNARIQFDIAEAQLQSARSGVDQAAAAVEEAREQLSKTLFTAPMDGRVTRLNVEEGETVIIGTMNNPGSLVLTISDLSVMEVVVEVDETSVPSIVIGDSASVRIDAFPEEVFSGRVTEIGNSAIVPPSQQASGQQAAIDFEVVVTLSPTDAELRPDLSATAEIITDQRLNVASVPYAAVTARSSVTLGSEVISTRPSDEDEDELDQADQVEGIFRVVDGTANFVTVELGISGRDHYEIASGVDVGDTVVAGPYQTVRVLRNGQAVRSSETSSN